MSRLELYIRRSMHIELPLNPDCSLACLPGIVDAKFAEYKNRVQRYHDHNDIQQFHMIGPMELMWISKGLQALGDWQFRA